MIRSLKSVIRPIGVLAISFAMCTFAQAAPLVGYSPNGNDPYGVPAGLSSGEYYERVFVTSQTFSIAGSNQIPPPADEFGGVATADYQVTNAAYNAGFIPTWNGTDTLFHALLSDSSQSAAEHIAPYVQGPIYNIGNQLVASSAGALWSGSIVNSITFDEYGDTVATSGQVWTGTNSDGGSSGLTADNWSSNSLRNSATVGILSATSGSWVDAGVVNSNGLLRLYAISMPFQVVPEPSSVLLAVSGAALLWRHRRRSAPTPDAREEPEHG